MLFIVCEQLNGENRSHKVTQRDVVTLACVVNFFSYYQIIPFIKAALSKYMGQIPGFYE